MNDNPKEEKGKNLPAISGGLDIFERFDALDDNVIIGELEQRVADKWVYHFRPKNAPEVWGLGKAGVDGCAVEMAKKGVALREEGVKHEIDPTNSQYVLFIAIVSKHVVDKTGAEATLEAVIGTKRQWTRMLLKDGKTVVPDPFWFEKGTQKAIRNAKFRLIPEEIKSKIIAFAKKEGKVKDVKDNGAPAIRTKRVDGEIATEEQTFKIAKLENTLVDKFDVDPTALLVRMRSDIGQDALIANLTGPEADVWIAALEIRIKNAEKKAQK